MDEDYDEIDLLIDTDPIELGRRLRTALAEVKRLGRLNDRLADRLQDCVDGKRPAAFDWHAEVQDR